MSLGGLLPFAYLCLHTLAFGSLNVPLPLLDAGGVLAAVKDHSKDLENAEVSGPIIGIDLGTTYSCVGIYRDGRVDIVPNDQGNRITPSYVAWDGEERLIGDAAKNQATVNPSNTVFDVKRLIGRGYSDSTVQADMKLWPFKVINKDNKPFIQVDLKGELKTFAPEEISGMVSH
jgi:endoplasmic reticulum chaperone BiP